MNVLEKISQEVNHRKQLHGSHCRKNIKEDNMNSLREEENALKSIYKKLNVDGTLKEPITEKEQILLFGIIKKLEEVRNGEN